MRIRAGQTAACIALSLSSAAFAGPGVWTTGGPYGGAVSALAVDPTSPATLYAGTWYAGIFKSRDSGRTWAAANAGLANPNSLVVYALAVAPRDPWSPTLYAATSEGGVFKSTDSGATWNATNTGLTELYVIALAVDPRNPSTLYAGTGDGVFKSTDAGATWIAANTGLKPDAFVYDIAIDPMNSATLYAGTTSPYGGGGPLVFKSTDAGGTWAPASTGLDPADPTWYADVYALAIDPADPATLYAGTTSPYGGGRPLVFKSTDAGGTWAPASTGLSPTYGAVRALAIDPTSPATLYAAASGGGVFKSTDSGATWNATNTGLTNLYLNALTIDPTNPFTLYAGTGDGISKSVNSGGVWTTADTGLTALDALAVALDPTNPATLYAGTSDRGVVKSTDAGGSWTAANTGLAPYSAVYALAIDPMNHATLYAGTGSSYGGKVFKSTDAGGGWAEASTGLFYTASTLAIDPTNPATLYAGTEGFLLGGPIGMAGGGVFKSIDSGGTWTRAGTGGVEGQLVETLAIDPSAPATVYAGACYRVRYGIPQPGGGVYKSTDAGGTWTSVSTGLTRLCVDSLAIDPTNPATLYAGTRGDGVFKSTDSGGSWKATNTGLTSLYVGTLAIHPTNPATLYAGTSDRGVFKSTDSGATWTSVNRGLLNLMVRALALEPTGETTVHAGLQGGSVWQATPPTGGDSPTLDFFTLAPCRLIDTRNVPGERGGPALDAGSDRVFSLVGWCGIPPTARAVSVNVTVTQPTAPGNLRLYPAGTPLPLASSINYAGGQTRANNAIAPLDERGMLAVRCSQASGTVHFILDVNGYFE